MAFHEGKDTRKRESNKAEGLALSRVTGWKGNNMGNGDRKACSCFATECFDGVVSVVIRIHDHVSIAKGVAAMVNHDPAGDY